MEPTRKYTTKDKTINLRVNSQRFAIIEQAAKLKGESDRTKYILEAAYRAAESDLLARQNFLLSEEEFAAFEKVLASPVKDIPTLKALLKEKAPWEK